MAETVAKKKHVSVVVAGHIDAGKSSFVGHLMFKLGGISERDLEKLKTEAKTLGKESFYFAFFMDRQKEERARGVTISCTTKEFFTENYHYTIIDAPGHRDFIKNMITGASQADVAVLMVPADGNFATSVQKGNHKENVVQGQTRQHARLLNLLGVKQLIVCVNKMDCDLAGYSQKRYQEVRDEAVNMLQRVGWNKNFVQKSVPIIPLSGMKGDNLLEPSDKMPWWKGVDVLVGKEKVHVHTVYDALNKMVKLPARQVDKPVRVPLSGVYKITGVGNVLTGRVEQGTVKPGSEVVFLPTHTASNPCSGRVFTVEMHHKSVPAAEPGDNVGLNVKGLIKGNMPRVGDVMVLKSDNSLRAVKQFTCQVQVLDEVPGELKPGYCPVAYVRTGRSAVKMTGINWIVNKRTGGKKLENPNALIANSMAEIVFEPCQPFVVSTFADCEGLGRVAIMEGHSVVMLGKVIKVEFKE